MTKKTKNTWENQEKYINKVSEFEEVCKPVLKYLNDNYHPHVAVIITPNTFQIVEWLMWGENNEFVKD